jgi:excisionase family DNA binding protein
MAGKPVLLPEQLLSVREVAELLGTSERFPRRLIAERRIEFVRVGRHVRIPVSALREFIKEGTVEPVIRKRGWVAPDALVFTSPNGAPMRDGNFRRRVWRPALVKAGLPAMHFHDLRHTGNTLTAMTGASLRELMAGWATAVLALR